MIGLLIGENRIKCVKIQIDCNQWLVVAKVRGSTLDTSNKNNLIQFKPIIQYLYVYNKSRARHSRWNRTSSLVPQVFVMPNYSCKWVQVYIVSIIVYNKSKARHSR